MIMFSGDAGILLIALLIFLAAGVTGALIGYFLMKSRLSQAVAEAEAQVKSAIAESERLIADAEAKAKTIELAAQERRVKIVEEAEAEIQRRRREMERAEERLQRRQEQLDSKLEQLEQRNRKLDQRQNKLDKREADIEKLEQEHTAELERIAGITRAEAKNELLEFVERDARQDMARKIREVEAETQANAEARAREIISNVMERVASDHVSETTVSTVPLPSDEMKGRIIGRQGRNIRAIEAATGVDLVVDDTPEAVILQLRSDPARGGPHHTLTLAARWSHSPGAHRERSREGATGDREIHQGSW
jgi:ribonuclease Y